MKIPSIKSSIFICTILFFQISAEATNWYISNTGDDNNSGNTPDDAIATIAELNTKILEPGDSVLFERGGVWRLATDDAMEINQSGTLNNHIVYTAYGQGDKPRLLGSNKISGWTSNGGNIWQASLNYNPRETGYGAELFCEDENNSYWTLNVNGDGGYSGMSEDLDWYWENNVVYLYSNEDPNTRFTSIEAPRTERHIYLNNNEYITIDNLELCYTTNVGIYDAYGSANIKGLRLTNCHIHHIGHKDSGQAFGASLKHSDMYIAYNDIHDCGRRNISLVTYETGPSMNISNILIEHNYLHHGWHTTGVDINTTGDHYYDSIVIRNNYFYDPIEDDITDEPPNKSLTSNHIFCADQGGGSFTKIYIYNNIFHGHKGNGVLMEGVDEVNVYYNTFYGFNTTLTGYATFVTVVNCKDIDIRNNVFYNNGNPSTERDLYIASVNDSSSYIRTTMEYNLWYKEIQNSRVFMLQNIGGNQTYYYYDLTEWEKFKNIIGYELNSPAPSDPNFMDIEDNNFNLLEGSPAIGKATPLDVVTTDYYGNTRNPETPTIGAIEYGNVINTKTEIKSFKILGQIGESVIDTARNTISIIMPYDISLENLTPTITVSTGATISPESGLNQDFNFPVEYIVTAEDGTTIQTWEITVTNAIVSEETDITTFSIPSQVGQSIINTNTHSIQITMPYGTNLSSLSPTFSLSYGATSIPASGISQDFSSPVTFTVTAEDGITTQDWTVSVINALSNETDILSFSIAGQVGQTSINNGGHSIQVTMPYGVNLSNLSPTFTLSQGATSNPASGVSRNFSSSVTYTITAEDGITTQNWVVTVNQLPSNETDILSFSIAGQVGQTTINNTEHNIQVTMPYGVNLSNLSPTFTLSQGATSNPVSGVSRNFSSSVAYNITAEDGVTTQNWTVSVINAPSNETDILSFSIAGQVGQTTINNSEHNIQITMPYEVSLSNLSPTFTLSQGATSNPASGVSRNFSSSVTYIVTAEDGITTQNWVVTVDQLPSNETDILSFSITGQIGQTTINTIDHSVQVTMPYGETFSNLSPTFVLSSGATSNIISGTSQNFSSPVIYSITAEDGSTIQNWTITVVNESSNETKIISFAIPGQEGQTFIDYNEHIVRLSMPRETDLSNLTPLITLSTGASSTPASNISQNFSSSIIYTITAANGTTTQDWTIFVTIAYFDETDITSFSLPGQIGQSIIDTTEHSIEAVMPTGTVLSDLLPDINLSSGASIYPISGQSQDFSFPFIYTVTAEDGITIQEWTVSVTNALSTETDIISFNFPGQIGESVIDTDNHTITIVMPAESALSNLVPTIIISDGATISPESNTTQDFTTSVLYSILAQDRITEQEWVVFVSSESETINVMHDESITKCIVFDIGLNNLNKSFSPVNIEWEIPAELDASSIYEENIKILPKQDGQFTLTLRVDDGNDTIVKHVNIIVEKLNPFAEEINIISVAASSFVENNLPLNSIDNNLNTKWLAGFDSESIVYELDEPTYLSHVEIAFFDGNKNKTNFEIHASSDNVTWENIYNYGVSCGFSNAFEAFDLSSESTSRTAFKYIKIIGHTIDETKNEVGSIAELKIFGSKTTDIISNSLQEKITLEVYPNPSTNYLTVSKDNLGDIRIIDSQGRTIYNFNEVNGNITINHNLKSGIYFLQYIQNNNKVITRKFIVK